MRDGSRRGNAPPHLAEREARYRMFDQCPAGIVIYDATLQVTDCNEAMGRLLGVPRGRLIGLRIDDLRDRRHREALRRALAGETVTYESPYQATTVEKWLWVSATFAPLRTESGAIAGVFVLVIDRSHDVDVADAAQPDEARLSEAQRLGRVGSWAWDVERNVAAASPEFHRILGTEPSSLAETPKNLERLIHPDDRAACRAQLMDLFSRRLPFAAGEFRVVRPCGAVAHVILRARIAYTDEGLPLSAWGTLQDVTERRRLEEQLRTAQRMESLGRLAGGVAHDFNNLLAIIQVETDFLGEGLPAGDPLHGEVRELRRAAQRAADLTRRLLAFSRKQILRPRVVDLNELVTETSHMLRRLIGEDIELATNLEPDLPMILADPGQLEQVLVNLVVNARDAMPDGGVVVIHTASAAAGQPDAPLPAGDYVVLSVSDTGRGMDAETRQRAFEPFFTTKPSGFGTGLGLSIVQGIVEQSGGSVSVVSEPGRGTFFTIHLPRLRHGDLPPEEATHLPPRSHATSHATVLLVEDEPSLRLACRRVLERAGYTVLAAEDGNEAVAIVEFLVGTVDLLITDLVLPGLNGREVAARLSIERPGMRVLYVSGYASNDIFGRGLLDGGTNLLEKPFTGDELVRAVERALHGA